MDEDELRISNTHIVTVGPQNDKRKWSRLSEQERMEKAFIKFFGSSFCEPEKSSINKKEKKIPNTTLLCKAQLDV